MNRESDDAEPEKADTSTENETIVDPSVLDSYKSLQQPGKPALVTKLINLFIKGTRKSLIELKKAAAEGDLVAVKRGAHAIKGSAGNMGANQMMTLCIEMGQAQNAGDAEILVSQLENAFKRVIAILNPMLKQK